MSFIRHVPWTRQPQVPSAINWGNPLTSGLVYAYNAANGKAIGGGPIGVGDARSSSGIVLGSTTSKTDTNIFSASADAVTLVVVSNVLVTTTGASAARQVLSFGGALRSYIGQTSFDGGTSIRSVVYYSPDFNGTSDIVVTSALANGPAVIVSTYQRNVSHTLYKNGVSIGSATPGNFAFNFSDGSSRGMQIGQSTGTSIQTAAAFVFLRCLSAAEVVEISKNPWQLFAPITRRAWLPQSGVAPAFLGAWARGSTTLVGSGLPGG